MEDSYPVSDRSRVRRHPERGSHERAAVYRILDEGLVCHVGIAVDGQATVIPMAFGRDGDRLILHGATGSRLLKALAQGCQACVAVTLLDGLVVARSAFDSSMNYRSVVAFGRARLIEGEAERKHALDILTDHLVPGRTREIRPPTAGELAATSVLELVIEEASAKERSGPPGESPAGAADGAAAGVWAGVVPLRLTAAAPEPAADVPPGAGPPRSVRRIVEERGTPSE